MDDELAGPVDVSPLTQRLGRRPARVEMPALVELRHDHPLARVVYPAGLAVEHGLGQAFAKEPDLLELGLDDHGACPVDQPPLALQPDWAEPV